jgi:hypothetical protein
MQIVGPGAVLYGEGQVLMMTKDGETAPWSGFGGGRPTGRPPAASYAVCGYFQTARQKLSGLNGITR